MPKGYVFWKGGELKISWMVKKAGTEKESQPTSVKDTNIIKVFESKKSSSEKFEVEVELTNGTPSKIHFNSTEIAESVEKVQTEKEETRRLQKEAKKAREKTESENQTQEDELLIDKNYESEFHNPYNFVPAPTRKITSTDLDDRPPIGHDKFYDDYFSGKLIVKMTVETPLVVLDTAKMTVDSNDHKKFPVRLENGKPFINPTAIRGMLRSAYEAVTNSRFGVFDKKHSERLAFRSEVSEGLFVVPARIENNKIVFYTGSAEIEKKDGGTKIVQEKEKGKPEIRQTQYAGWINTYYSGNCSLGHSCLKLVDEKRVPRHKEKVFAWISETKHRSNRFEYWKVEEIALNESKLNPAPPRNSKKVFGYVCITGKNEGKDARSTMGNKHDERLFFNFHESEKGRESDSLYNSVLLTQALEEGWNNLIKNYRIDKNEDNRPKINKNGQDIKLQWSRHIRQTTENEVSPNVELKNEKLENDSLCYAKVKWNGSDFEVLELFPVMISRRLHKSSPKDFLNGTNLEPAKSIGNLSPADRVFGWVNQNGQGASRGQLRVGSIICNGVLEKKDGQFILNKIANPTHKFDNELPLNILGQPKPQQGRFYVAENQNGDAQTHQRNNENAGYKIQHNGVKRGLRGRKVYPHHAGLPTDYWTIQNGLREYQRPNNVQDSQNRSIKGWIKPQTEFTFDIHFTNLSKVELGALIWLLKLPEKHFHRFGGGKPLGFGSVRLDLVGEEITSGKDLQTFYLSLDSNLTNSTTSADCKIEFETIANQNILDAFKIACNGFNDNLPIHYPRLNPQPHPEGKSFEWFVANNKSGKDNSGRKLSLPNLIEKRGLPRNPIY